MRKKQMQVGQVIYSPTLGYLLRAAPNANLWTTDRPHTRTVPIWTPAEAGALLRAPGVPADAQAKECWPDMDGGTGCSCEAVANAGLPRWHD